TERDYRHCYKYRGGENDAAQEHQRQLARAVFGFSCGLRQRFKARIRKEQRREARRQTAPSMREEGRVVGGVNREQSGNHQHHDREAEQHTHHHLDSTKPTHTDYVNQIEEEQTAHRKRLMSKLTTDTTAAQFDYVISQRAGEICARADVRNYLQP